MKRIFLSYARQDQPYAERLRSVLISWGLQPWMDVHDLRPGEQWWEEIDNGLRTADVVLGLLSTNSVISTNVAREWNWALSAKRKLVPMRLAQVDPALMSHRFTGLQWIDFHRDEAAGFDVLRRELENPFSIDQNTIAVAERPVPRHKKSRDSRSQMLDRVHAYWISGVLYRALTEANRFNIGYELKPDAVVRHSDYSDCALPSNTDFNRFFDSLGSEMLILGTPGSGKTILLLQLAEKLLAAARRDSTASIPMVLNLSSWSRRESLADWIVSETGMSYQVPRRAVRRWLEDEMIIPLLDGLDEVQVEHREACVEAINDFHCRYRGVGVAVCSRIADYLFLKNKLDLRAAILLQPLTEEQVAAVLNRPELRTLRGAREKEPWLAEMTRTPFLLNVMSYAYADKEEPAIRLPPGESGEKHRRFHLFDTYISRRLADGREGRRIPGQKIRATLAWLAARMTEHKHSIFHLEAMQKDWLSSLWARCAFCFGSRVVFAWLAAFLFWVGGTIVVDSSLPLFTGKRAQGGPAILLVPEFIVVFTFAGICAANAELTRVGRNWLWQKKFLAAINFIFTTGFIMTAIFGFATIALWLIATAIYKFDIDKAVGYKIKASEQASFYFVFIAVPYLVLCGASIGAGACCVVISRICDKCKISNVFCINVGSYALYWILSIFLLYFAGRMLANSGSESIKASYIIPTLLIGCIIAIIRGVEIALASIYKDNIESADRIQWRWNWIAAVACGVSMFTALLGCIVLVYLGTEGSVKNVYSHKSAINLFLFGMVSGILGGVVFGFRRGEHISYRLVPGEGIFRSIRLAAVLSVSLGASAFLIILGLFYFFGSKMMEMGTELALIAGAFMASIGAMIGGADVPAKYIVLRILLYFFERLPWKLRQLLDLGASHFFIRRVGGGYIFIHRLLQEHFAQVYHEQQLSR